MPPSNPAPLPTPAQLLWKSLPLATFHPLSPREAEVLDWISEGKRDREIATILGLSARTVERHVYKILKKLHLETRTAASRWWHERLRAIENLTKPPAAPR